MRNSSRNPRQRRGPSPGRGFALLQTLLAISLMAAVMTLAAQIQKDMLSYDRVLRNTLEAQQDSRRAFALLTNELRVANVAETGAYPILTAGANALTFYADADGDGLTERYRYTLDGSALRRGVTKPTGNPLAYVDANETVTDVITSLANGGTPLFEYYPATYAGSGNALAQPVSVSQIRLVKITAVVDRDPSAPPVAQTFTTMVMLRNLKDNL